MTDGEASMSQGQVLKRDARGRVQTTAAQREALLEQFGRSGLSGPVFARVAGINYQTFATWRQERRKRSVAAGAAPPQAPVCFVEAVMAQPRLACGAGAVLQVSLPGGASLHVADAAQAALAAGLIRALCDQQPC